MSIEFFEYMVVVLVYRNITDLIECINSIHEKILSCKVIVVNAFYDESSCLAIKKAAQEKKCDFLNIENKGYGYGNNQGVQYAINHYKFKYIIISNPDVIIKKFNDSLISKYDVIAPAIVTLNGKNQNPMLVKKVNLAERFIYIGLKKGKRIPLFVGILINKIIRTIYLIYILFRDKRYYPMYCPHGSFVILSKEVINKLLPIYDENIFLFAEESVLAYKLKRAGFQVYFTKDIKIIHKEDGSMKMSEFSINDELKKANIYYYEHY